MTNSSNSYFTHRAFEARQSALDATNPVVRAIFRDLDQRFRQLAAFPNTAPLRHTDWLSHPTADALALQPNSAAGESAETDRDEQASIRDSENWENEGGKCARGNVSQ